MPITLNDIQSGYNLEAINDNFTTIEEAWDEKLDRLENSQGNSMSQDLDMNGNTILNLPLPTEPTHPLRLKDLGDGTSTGGTALTTSYEPTTDIVTSTNVQHAIDELADLAYTGNMDGQDIDVTETVDLSGKQLLSPKTRYVADASMTTPVVTATSESNEDITSIDIAVKGNGVYNFTEGDWDVEPTTDGLYLDDARSPLSDYTVRAYACDTACVVNGDTEKKKITVHGAYCNQLYKESIENGGSPDELIVQAIGTRCKKVYSTIGEVSSHVTFAFESNIQDDDIPYVVTLEQGKNVTLSGEIRGIKGGCIKAYRETDSWLDSVVFDDLKMIQVDAGIALYAQKAQRLSGNLNIYDCQNDDGATVQLVNVQDVGGLNMLINKCYSLYGLQIGNSGNSCVRMDLDVQVQMGDTYSGDLGDGIALYVQNASTCNFNCKLIEGGILIDNAANCTFNIPSTFITNQYEFTGETDSHVNVTGKMSLGDISLGTWYDQVGSVYFEYVYEIGGSLTYTDSKWTTPMQQYGNDVDFRYEQSNYNQTLKRQGFQAFDNTYNNLLYANGNNSSASWYDPSGTEIYSPGESDEIAVLDTYMPNALTGDTRAAYDRLYFNLRSKGLMDKLTALWVFWGEDEDNAKINLIQDAYHLSDGGTESVTFTPGLGFSGSLESADDSDRAYLYSATDALESPDFGDQVHLGAYAETTESDSRRDIEDFSTVLTMRARPTTGSYFEGNTEDQVAALAASIPYSRRHTCGTRDGTVAGIYVNGNLSNRITGIDDTLSGGFLRFIRSERTMGACHIGGALTGTEVYDLSSALTEFRKTMFEITGTS